VGLEESEARNDFAGEGQQKFNPPTELASHDRIQHDQVRRRQNNNRYKNRIEIIKENWHVLLAMKARSALTPERSLHIDKTATV
jgi:hypothetical protein